MATAADDQLLTVADVAGYIGAHEQTVRVWIRSGELVATRFGNRIGWRIKRADLDRFLTRRQVAGAVARLLLDDAGDGAGLTEGSRTP